MSENKNKINNAGEPSRVERELLQFEEDRSIDSWRIFKIMSEFVEGFELLRKHSSRSATFFGSARCELGDDLYNQVTDLSGRLSKSGFTIVTGGAAGVMEAANKGAFDAGGESVGLNIRLPNEQETNAYLTDSMHFRYFFSRKVMLSFASEAYVYFPGGFGTMDEFFELVTLIQTKKIRPIPVVLVGKDFWEPLVHFIKESLAMKYHTINEKDVEIFTLVDSVDEAYEVIVSKVNEFCQKHSC